MIGKLIRFTVLILLAPLIYAFTYEAFLFFFGSGITLKSIQWFLLGFALAILLYVLLPRDRIRFWSVFEHEFIHLITGVVLLRRPSRFVVDLEANGETGMQPGCGTPISLAPYFLPLLTLPFLAIRLLVPPSFHEVANFLIGFTLAFHYASLIAEEFRFSQDDFRNTGVIFSAVVTILLNIVFLVVILGIVTGNHDGIVDYFKNSYDRRVEAYRAAIDFLEARAIPTISEWLGR